MIGIEAKGFQKQFFTSSTVTKAVDKGTRKALSAFGAAVRGKARDLVDTRGGTSRPGQPPRMHKGTIRRFIYFGYNPAERSVVIGPVLAGSRSGAPAALEHGERSIMTFPAGPERGKTIRLTIAPRPFMGPAFAAKRPELPQFWKNAIT